MRNRFFKLALAAMAAAALFASCSKEKNTETEIIPDAGVEKITIRAVMPESMPTRVQAAVPESGTGMSWTWQADDKLTVIGTTTQTFTIKSGASSQSAEFEGTPVEGSSFTILYPGTCTTLSQAEAIDWNSQKQVGNNSAAHLLYAAALKNVNAYEEFEFSPDWAAAHGGTLQQSGVMKFVITLPEAITGVTKLSTVAPGGAAKLNLAMENVVIGDDHLLTAYVAFPWYDLAIPAGTPITLTLTAADGADWTKTVTFTEATTISSGMVNKVQLNASNWALVFSGTGEEADPYLISNASQFKAFDGKLVEGETRWFKLDADLDLGAETSWTPVHPAADTKRFVFDGQNHTIKNLTASFDGGYASVFGAINGTVKNLKFHNCHLTYTHASGGGPLGILAGWAGHSSNTAIDATVENVHATECSVTSNSTGNTVGGLVGRCHNAKFKNCSFSGAVERTATGASGYKYIGGLAGSDEWAGNFITTFEGCSTAGTLTVKSGNSCGGILGGTNGAAYVRLTDCHSTMDITTAGTVSGGIQGYVGGAEFTSCTYDGTLTNTTKSNADGFAAGIAPYCYHYVKISKCSTSGEIINSGRISGGIMGNINPQAADTEGSSITDCHSTMKISASARAGGIIASCANSDNGGRKTVARCSYNGDITSGDWCGGIIGFIRNADVEDCSFSGTLVGKGQRSGGIVGNLGGGNAAVRRCFCDADLKTTSLNIGGIVGMAQITNSVEGTHKNENIAVEECIAWSLSVKAEAGTIAQWGSGAICGSTAGKNTLADCYRNPAMVLSYNCANTEWPLLYDQENASESSVLVYYGGAAEAPATCQSPYHGKAAAAGKTAAQVAADLDWNTAVWDLGGSVPQLIVVK